MRPKRLVASAALIAVLAVVALPQVVGSRTPSQDRPVEAAAFQAVQSKALAGGSVAVYRLDDAARSANALAQDATLVEPSRTAGAAPGRPAALQGVAAIRSAIKPPRYSLTGLASWYDNGTTAMRLPYGTTVRICGAGGCVIRQVTDWGPSAAFRPVRIVDLMPSDFRAVCGCSWWSGLTTVRVDVY